MTKRLFLFLLVVTACGKTHHETEEYVMAEALAPAEFERMIADSVVLLDVRTPGEFETGSIPGAINLDYKADDFEQKLDDLDKSKWYFVYCASGARSDKASDLMIAKGFSFVVTLDGGMSAWTAEGRPVQK